MEKWTQKFSEMGSRNKKTGKLNYYTVTRTHNKGIDSFKCSCPATDYRPYLVRETWRSKKSFVYSRIILK